MSNDNKRESKSRRLNLHIKAPLWLRLQAYVRQRSNDADVTYAGVIARALDRYLRAVEKA